MGAETNILRELNNVVQYSKQVVSLRLAKLMSDRKVDISTKDAATLVREFNFSLEKVYRDMAPGFSKIREDIQKERANKESRVEESRNTPKVSSKKS